MTDEQLVRRVLTGETAFFESLLHRHSQQVYRAARAILRDDEEAADVVQETYLRAYRNLKQFAGRAKFSTWLTRIAVYEARARHRKSRMGADKAGGSAVAKAVREETTPELDPEKRALVGEVGTMVEAAIDALPDLYRTVFVMRAVEELSTADTAACLNLSQDAVKTRLHRARALLRKKLYASAGPARREAFRFAGKRCLRMWVEKILPAIRSFLPAARPARTP
ncbi:MAG: RNA polymerase sigma factor [Acidobacteriota bacterium]|nr:RNA polymerase sigma factor [Acidobacteriota bacterium]